VLCKKIVGAERSKFHDVKAMDIYYKQICVLFILIMSCLGHLYLHLWMKDKTRKKIFICFYILCAISVVCYVRAYFYERSMQWKKSAFEGEIVSMVITKEHAIREYTIKNGDHIITFNDPTQKLFFLKIGDYVKKEAGKDTMEVKSK